MNVYDVLHELGPGRTLLIGYYGGTNYGDELLLEVLSRLIGTNSRISLYYSRPDTFTTYHRDLGFHRVASHWETLKEVTRSRQILIGGGGIWGLDANLNVFLLSATLFIAGLVLRKRVVLVGVWYYNSTTFFGHVSAFLAGATARAILARDRESYENFMRYSQRTLLDQDLSFYIRDLSLDEYAEEAAGIAADLGFTEPCVMIGLRRFGPRYRNAYADRIADAIRDPKVRFCVIVFESRAVAPREYAFACELAARYENCIARDFSYNPLAFYRALGAHRNTVRVIAPQYHVQISAHENGVPFLPIDYDAKNREFFVSRNIRDAIKIADVTLPALNAFIRA
jgi:polysaccharide pyruvyl transferase WcaK-like protein